MENKTVTITWGPSGEFKILSDTANSMELLGMLRYAEKEAWAVLWSHANQNDKAGMPMDRKKISDLQPENIRLANALIDYRSVYGTNFVDEVEKTKFLRLRNCGIGTWKLFVDLKNTLP